MEIEFKDKDHKYFLQEAALIATRSKDPSTKTGAVIVRPDRTIVSKGYNGFPIGYPDSDILYADRDTKYKLIVHCEMNAILSAREPLHGYTLYTWPFLSCPRCAVHVIQAGITRVVAPRCPDDKLDRWEEALEDTKGIFRQVGVEVIEF